VRIDEARIDLARRFATRWELRPPDHVGLRIFDRRPAGAQDAALIQHSAAAARVRSNRDGHLVPSSGAGELFQIRLAGCDRAGPYDPPIGAAACGRGNSVMAVQSNRQTCLGLLPGFRRAGRARIGRQC